MLPRNYLINSPTQKVQNIIPTSSAYNSLSVNKTRQKQKPRQRTTNTITTIATTSFFSVNITNINSSSPFSSSTSSTQQQISFEDSYSVKTGIKTAALLGGMLLLVIVYLIWKARARICRFNTRSSSAGLGPNPRLSTAKFDLEYWLKQVDLLEAKEVERNRGGQSLYLELPKIEARDNREATASWIVDAYRHWRLRQYRQQQSLRQNENPQSETEPVPYRRRRYLFRRFFRRFFTSSRQRSSFLTEHSPALITGMRPSIVSNNFIPPPLSPSLQHRRTASWPRLKSNHQAGTSMSALQTHLARKRLLKRASRTTFEI